MRAIGKKMLLNQIYGVMLLSLRAALRARVVLCLVVVQLLLALTLPHVIKGDGTPGGELEILLTYTLGFCFAIQTLAALWASCALFAGEIVSRRIQMSVVKPAGFLSLWAGRWLALLVLNVLLLTLVYALVYTQIRLTQRNRGWPSEILPGAMHVARPQLPTLREEALQIYQKIKSADELPPDMSRAEILRTLEEQAAERYDVINPGDEFQLDFNLVRTVRPDEHIVLRMKFDTAYGTRGHVRGICRLHPAGDPDNFVEHTLDSVTQSVLRVPFETASFMQRSAFDEPLRTFRLSFRFESDADEASALLLRMRQDIAVMIDGGSFEMNLLRSAFVQAGVLAVMSAFGLTLSAFFSFPVAAFAASVSLALILMSGGVLPMVTKEDEKKTINRVGIQILRAASYVTRNVTDHAPLASLAAGERISRRVLLVSACWNMGLVPLLLALSACVVLRRRELADVH